MRLTFNTLEAPLVPLRILLMSPYGAGKTYLMGYIARRLGELTHSKMKLFDFDIGWQTLKSAKFDLDVTSYLVDPENMGQAFEEFDEDFHKYLSDPNGYGGFGLDSLTTLQTCAMDYVLKENRKLSGESIKRRTVGRFELTNENDFGVLVTMMMQVFPQILKISTRAIFVMTAHIRSMEDRITGTQKIFPAISGRALPSQIGGWFNEVWFLKAEGYKGDIIRIAQTGSDSQVDCKTQVFGMPFEVPVEAAVEKALLSYGINKEPSDEVLALLKSAGVPY